MKRCNICGRIWEHGSECPNCGSVGFEYVQSLVQDAPEEAVTPLRQRRRQRRKIPLVDAVQLSAALSIDRNCQPCNNRQGKMRQKEIRKDHIMKNLIAPKHNMASYLNGKSKLFSHEKTCANNMRDLPCSKKAR